ncbi:hypothetical protein DRQ18_04945 [bacterium]|nr:MAG: hypothetical protein DRQ18_04945 [bacterium]
MNREKALRVKNALSQEILFRPGNIIKTAMIPEGWDVGRVVEEEEPVNGVGLIYQKGTYGIKIFLEKKIKINTDVIAEYFGVLSHEIKIECIGRIEFFFNTTARHRPAFPGVSIGHPSITAGTFGCLVEDDSGIYILSNNHVLANLNRACRGDPILQPGPADGGKMEDQIAELTDYVPIDVQGINYVDAAIAQPLDYSDVLPDIPFIGKVNGITHALIGKRVAKYGRSTGFSVGKITARNVDIKVMFNGVPVWFSDQIEIRARGEIFSAPGDSGALVVEYDTRRAVGVLFAGTGRGVSFANPISEVLTTLGVNIL